MAPSKPAPVELSIGALSAATGVPIETLRTWERRYGFPQPLGRTDGSHRRYAADVVAAVRLIVQALERGHRPAGVVGRSTEELRQLLAAAPAGEGASAQHRALAHWLELTRELDGEGLAHEFERELASLPVLPFLEQRMGPFLTELGERWARQELSVMHEHFASERAREFSSSHWRALSEGGATAPVRVVLATPPGERHVLGLHMAAWVAALAGAKIIFLGADTPSADVALAADRHQAAAVVLSVAAGYRERELQKHLTELVRRLPVGVPVAIGGAGARPTAPRVRFLNRFSELQSWVEQLRGAGRGQ